jgi:murein DD-endopeptidase MepM/ murein hydrolase activator NlpD
MRSPAGSVKFSLVLRASTACLLALGVSACSSDTLRFTDTPFDSPFKTAQAPARDPATTGSIGRSVNAPVYATPAPATASVRSQPLPPPQSAVALRSAAPQPVAGSAAGWSAQGGSPIVLAQGETLDMISSRYGVPRAALMSTNGLSSPNVAPGTRLTIPVYNAAASASPAPAAPRQQLAQAPAETRSDASRFVTGPAPAASVAAPRPAAPALDARARAAAAAETKAKAAAEAKAKAEADAVAMRESRARFAAEAKAKAAAKAGTTAAAVPTPVAKPAVAARIEKPAATAAAKPAVAQAQPVRAAEKAKPVVVASAPATEPKVTAVPKAEAEPTTTASLPKVGEPGEKADFRWPARGRVIAGFSGRGGNEGINIAVPEGTPVKAAESGTVAYAGSELKGYGNLVLIRHPNGYVSAYAHNGELKVKRGDTVKRGQVVASSGQTGNVSSPQLHFELRKGSAPVDPTPYLNN